MRESGRCQLRHQGRSQLLDGEYIHVVPPQNAEDRGRVSCAAAHRMVKERLLWLVS